MQSSVYTKGSRNGVWGKRGVHCLDLMGPTSRCRSLEMAFDRDFDRDLPLVLESSLVAHAVQGSEPGGKLIFWAGTSKPVSPPPPPTRRTLWTLLGSGEGSEDVWLPDQWEVAAPHLP